MQVKQEGVTDENMALSFILILTWITRKRYLELKGKVGSVVGHGILPKMLSHFHYGEKVAPDRWDAGFRLQA
jgi:hypothetical protein